MTRLGFWCWILLWTAVAQAEILDPGLEAYRMGNFAQAIEFWQAKLVAKARSASRLEIYLYLVDTYRRADRPTEELEVLQQASAMSEELGDTAYQARFLVRLGAWYGQAERGNEAWSELARSYSQQAEELARALGKGKILLDVLPRRSAVVAELDSSAEAKALLREALALAVQFNDREALTQIRTRWAALDAYESAAAVNALKDLPAAYDKILHLLEVTAAARQEIEKSKNKACVALLPVISEAVSLARKTAEEIGNPRMLSSAYGSSGDLYGELAAHCGVEPDWEQARALTRRALFFAEQSANPEVDYRRHWQMGRIYRAESAFEEAIRAYTEASSALDKVRRKRVYTEYLHDPFEFEDDIRPVYLELAELYLLQAEQAADENARQTSLQKLLDTLERLKAAELEDYFEDECVEKGEESVEALLDARTAVLYPVIFEQRTVVLVKHRAGLKLMAVEIATAGVKEAAEDFFQEVMNPLGPGYRDTAQKLHAWLIAPALEWLRTRQIETLVIAPDGILRKIPFAALHDGERFLGERYALAVIPSLRAAVRQVGAPGDVFLGGVSESVQELPPLRQVLGELKTIQALHEDGLLRLNGKFTASQIGADLSGRAYRLIHFATHAEFAETVRDSFLLAYDEKLTLNKLENMFSRTRGMDLITLSACETAQGNERAALGLAGVALKLGANSALASLWRVSDDATPRLMEAFYRALQAGKPKAQALQTAQRSLLASAEYRHPYYWSPFILIGQWD